MFSLSIIESYFFGILHVKFAIFRNPGSICDAYELAASSDLTRLQIME
jgi:hypothetical protein